MKLRIAILTSALILLASSAYAGCTCQCVDGEMQPLCDSSIDVRPVCPPMPCMPAPPSVAPVVPMTPYPMGTSECRNAQVCDNFGNCRWQRVCE